MLIGPLVTNIIETLTEHHLFLFTKMHLKTSSAKWRPFCLGRNVLSYQICFWLKAGDACQVYKYNLITPIRIVLEQMGKVC